MAHPAPIFYPRLHIRIFKIIIQDGIAVVFIPIPVLILSFFSPEKKLLPFL
ncbi:MAG TPA: hypothetical protein H9761_00060 [Candidatus Eisenbergiella merdavium]|uniref:Uncharacterized protein n=1 Tax=Candidatus Eisenbergiella merdavium TaxID=2838551 RepID=A0A9D2NBM0_9FIRM|nr:hypothetical protein [Candidatus Eisenbergiella merdavium]